MPAMSRTNTAVRVISASPDRVFAVQTDPGTLPGPLRDPLMHQPTSNRVGSVWAGVRPVVLTRLAGRRA